ncbi:hypothetical protein DFA_04382 [Cavenderia fasciculata]|uniref:Uncharacterized protein n=1 Tax=Cavenderia fasciculata TaxID=261658 RepID=F4PPF1_CACFS|nr:uncharacterized protein DFA_04382 [Cavenderia fasciculata]EGG22264.1 hypothetical protein DFA_04382 [Cavenderia fasciculata]|eukprot:XP_004360115.1 hypothetical protein DFA_04382 [Cavenderia fasciculata]
MAKATTTSNKYSTLKGRLASPTDMKNVECCICKEIVDNARQCKSATATTCDDDTCLYDVNIVGLYILLMVIPLDCSTNQCANLEESFVSLINWDVVSHSHKTILMTSIEIISHVQEKQRLEESMGETAIKLKGLVEKIEKLHVIIKEEEEREDRPNSII